jgi:hypothetical protein
MGEGMPRLSPSLAVKCPASWTEALQRNKIRNAKEAQLVGNEVMHTNVVRVPKGFYLLRNMTGQGILLPPGSIVTRKVLESGRLLEIQSHGKISYNWMTVPEGKAVVVASPAPICRLEVYGPGSPISPVVWERGNRIKYDPVSISQCVLSQ